MTKEIYQEMARNKAARDGVLLTLKMMGVKRTGDQRRIMFSYNATKPDYPLCNALKVALEGIHRTRNDLKPSKPLTTADRLREKIKAAWFNPYPKSISGAEAALPNTPEAREAAGWNGSYIALTSRWYREVHKRGLQTVAGLVILDVAHLSTGGRVALFKATWIRKQRGQSFVREEGVIAQDTFNGCAMYGSTVKGAKKALTNEIRRQVVARLTGDVLDPRAAVPV